MSTQWQSDLNEYGAQVAFETPPSAANGERVTDANPPERAEVRDRMHDLLREIATGYYYIGIARWSRDSEIVRANLHCALRVLQSIDTRLAAAPADDPVGPKLQCARDRLSNRLLDEFGELLDRVVHELPAVSGQAPGSEAIN